MEISDQALMELLKARNTPKSSGIGSGTGIVRPKELDDPNTPAELRASVQSAYTAALMDAPASLLSEIEKASIRSECTAALARDGYRVG